DATSDDRVRFSLQVGTLSWDIQVQTGARSLDEGISETVRDKDQLFYVWDRPSNQLETRLKGFGFGMGRSALRQRYEFNAEPALKPLVEAVHGFSVYADYGLARLRQHGSQNAADTRLRSDGTNVLTVLRNWRDRREMRPSYDYVIQGLRSAFPDLFEELDFQVAGQTLAANLYSPGKPYETPLHRAPNGLVVGLIHLCGVAGAPRDSLIAIDEVENALHPYAIRELIATFREIAAKRDLTVVLATHSPVVLNEFKDDPSKIFVMQPGEESLPVALDQYRDPDWLAHFALGDLYS